MTSTLVINVSNYVSPYCYSLLRANLTLLVISDAGIATVGGIGGLYQ